MTRKGLVIMRSEFMRRVTSKTFILTTLLGPVLLAGFLAVMVVLSVSSLRDEFVSTPLRVAIVDGTGVLGTRILAQDAGEHILVTADIQSAREGVREGELDAYIHIPEEVLSGTLQPVLYSNGGDLQIRILLGRIIEMSLEDHLLAQANVTADVRAILDRTVWLDTIRLNEEHEGRAEEAESFDESAIIGGILGIIMYLSVIIYGSLILYGVTEERRTRVVEIIVSSVRPFDLLMGKILGIGLVGFVQIGTWMIMIVGGLVVASPLIGIFVDPAIHDLPAIAGNQEILPVASISVPRIPTGVLVWFVLYFVGGYLLYGGIYAVIGTLVDTPQDSQKLLIPLVMPMLISIMFMSPVIMNPDSGLAFGLSIFPMTSPVPMIVRMTVGEVPFWQLLLSYGLLVLSFLGSIWGSARVYRTSILMYGKKASFRSIIGYLRSS